MAIIATLLIAETQMTNRLRSERGRHRLSPWVAGLTAAAAACTDTAHRMDHRFAPGVDLAAQIGDVEVDDAGPAAEAVVPHPVQDLGAGDSATRVAHQIPQQLELGGGQRDLLVAPGDLTTRPVQHKIAHLEHLVLGRGGGLGPAQQAPQPGDQLLEAERLGQIVVGSRGQPPRHPVHHRIPRRQEQRRRIASVSRVILRICSPSVSGSMMSSTSRSGSNSRNFDKASRPSPAVSTSQLVVQGHLDQIRQRRLVVDEKYADGRTVGAGDARKLPEDGLTGGAEGGRDVDGATGIAILRFWGGKKHMNLSWTPPYLFHILPGRGPTEGVVVLRSRPEHSATIC